MEYALVYMLLLLWDCVRAYWLYVLGIILLFSLGYMTGVSE